MEANDSEISAGKLHHIKTHYARINTNVNCKVFSLLKTLGARPTVQLYYPKNSLYFRITGVTLLYIEKKRKLRRKEKKL